MQSHFSWMLSAQLLCAVTFVIIWAKGFAGRNLGTGAVFGLLMGLFQNVWAIVNYVVLPMPAELAVKWFFSGLAQAVLLGIVTSLVYRPEPSGP
jgi:ATP/ADP translocase